MVRVRSAPVISAALARSRFLLLLLCLLGLFAIHPLFSQRAGEEAVVALDAPLFAVLLACIWSVSQRRSVLLAGIALVAPALLATWLVHTAPDRSLALTGLVSALAFVVFTTGAVLWSVLRERAVSTDTIIGGICVYFLLGLIWALIYSLLERSEPGSFMLPPAARGDLAGTLLVSELLYYSVFVLTAIGPQSVHPVTGAARAWTGLEAMAGQLFVAVLIARLVGLHVSTPGRKP